MNEPALAMIEFKSIARGILATNELLKKAPVRLIQNHPISPGKYICLFAGEVGDVEESLEQGILAAGDSQVNSFLIPNVHEMVMPAIERNADVKDFESIGIVETFSVASCVKAADIAAKASHVQIVDIRLGQGLGGKAYLILTGKLYDLEASMEEACEYVKSEGMLASRAILENPHQDLLDQGMVWS